MDAILHDLKSALRSLRRTPGIALTAVLVLAIGIGASTAMYAYVDKIVLRPFTFPIDRLALVFETSARYDRNEISPGLYEDLRTRAKSFGRLSAYQWHGANLTGVQEPERLLSYRVTPDLFETIGVKPALGRGFLPEEGTPGRDHVAILTHELWQRRFGGDPAILGGRAVIDGESYTVVGITARDLRFPKAVQLYIPFTISPAEREVRAVHGLLTVGRLREGVSAEQARSEVSAIAKEAQAEHPLLDPGHGATVFPMTEYGDRMTKIILVILMGAVGIVFLVACANVANLLLVRATARSREVAIRAALGATRGRIVRQLLAETALLALAACALGIVFGSWGVEAIRLGMPANISRFIAGWNEVSVDRRILVFAAFASVASCLVAGLAPALSGSRLDLQATLQRDSQAASGSRERRKLRSALVVAQIALALVLAADAGLLVRTLRNYLNAPLGFDAENVLTARVGLSTAAYRDDASVVRYFDDSLRRIRALPGVVSAGIVSRLPLSGSWNDAAFVVEGSPEPRAEEQPSALLQAVTEGTFAALGVPLLQGRAFGEMDRGGPPACIVSAAFSRKYLGGEALGRRLLVGSRRGPCAVVGVVGNVRHVDLEDERQMAIYRPEMQMPDREVAFAIRSSVPPEKLARAVRAELLAVDRDQPVSDVVSLRQSVDDNALLGWRYAAGLAGSFALIALLLSGVGVYAVMAVSVAQRSREMGIRMALGAGSPDVVRLVLGQGLKTAALGIAIGLAVALASARILEGVVYGVAPRDPLTLGVVSLFLFAVAAFACSLPARRATRVDPVAVLRAE